MAHKIGSAVPHHWELKFTFRRFTLNRLPSHSDTPTEEGNWQQNEVSRHWILSFSKDTCKYSKTVINTEGYSHLCNLEVTKNNVESLCNFAKTIYDSAFSVDPQPADSLTSLTAG